ncbi:MAG: hypothetical protein Q4P30_03860 [Eubacteriales bacterium]|nr:hypothetical protein [Eubacteriales bacterium]
MDRIKEPSDNELVIRKKRAIKDYAISDLRQHICLSLEQMYLLMLHQLKRNLLGKTSTE